MTDIVKELRQASLNQGDYRWEAADEIERLRQALESARHARFLQRKASINAANEIYRLRSALERIAFGKYHWEADAQEEARAALEVK